MEYASICTYSECQNYLLMFWNLKHVILLSTSHLRFRRPSGEHGPAVLVVHVQLPHCASTQNDVAWKFKVCGLWAAELGFWRECQAGTACLS